VWKAQDFGIWKGAEGGPDLGSRRTGECEDLGSAFSLSVTPVKDGRFAGKSEYGKAFYLPLTVVRLHFSLERGVPS